MMLENFIEKVNGQVVSSDNVPANAGQSVQLIAEWCKYLGLPFQWTSPAYWWDDFDTTFTEYWTKHTLSEGVAYPIPGDIIIFGSDLPGSGGHGAGSIFLRAIDGNSFEALDANWGSKSVHKQSHTWAYVTGWFTPKNPSVLQEPTPTAIGEEAPYAPYEVQIIPAKIVTARLQPTALYNLNDVSYDSLLQNPVSHVPAEFEITVTAIAKHRLGGTYYMPDSEKAEGYLLEDCEDYMDKGIQPEDAELYTGQLPPDEMIIKPGTGILSPLSAPNMNDTIVVDKRIPYYISMSGALNHVGSVGTLTPTTYYVYKRVPNGMLSLTSTPGQSMRMWINPEDLKEPAPWSWETAVQLYDKPKWFQAIAASDVVDFEGRRAPLKISLEQHISIDGEILINNQLRGIPSATNKLGQKYHLPMDILEEADPPKPKIVPAGVIPVGPLVSQQPRRTGTITAVHYPEDLPELPLIARIYLRTKKFFGKN
jgi:hypothetical protein